MKRIFRKENTPFLICWVLILCCFAGIFLCVNQIKQSKSNVSNAQVTTQLFTDKLANVKNIAICGNLITWDRVVNAQEYILNFENKSNTHTLIATDRTAYNNKILKAINFNGTYNLTITATAPLYLQSQSTQTMITIA